MPRNDFLIPSSESSVELTTANTARQVPATAIAFPHELVVSNVATADVYVRTVTGTSGGIKLASGQTITVPLAPSQAVFAYSDVALQTINASVYQIP